MNVSVIGEVGLLSFLEVWNTEIGGGLPGTGGSSHPLTEKLFPPSVDSTGPPIIVAFHWKIVNPPSINRNVGKFCQDNQSGILL